MNFGQIVNQGIPELDQVVNLERCPDKKAKIHIKIHTSLIGEINDYEAMSQTTANVSRIDEPMIDEPKKKTQEPVEENRKSITRDTEKKSTLNSSKDVTDRLMDEIKTLRQDKNDLESNLKEAESAAIEYQNKSKRLEQYIQGLDTEKFRMEDSLRKSQTEVENLRGEIVSKVNEMEELKDRQIKCLNEKLEVSSKDFELGIQNMNEKIAQQGKREDELQLKIMELENQVSLNNSVLKGSKNEVSAIEQENLNLRSILDTLKADFHSCQLELESSQSKMESQSNQIAILEEELAAQTTRFQEWKNEGENNEKLTTENSSLKSQISSLTSENSSLKSQLSSLTLDISSLQTQNSTQISSLKSQLLSQISQSALLKLELKAISNDSSSKEKSLKSFCDDLKMKYEEKKQDMEELEKENREICSEISVKNAEIDHLEGINIELESKEKNFLAEIENLKDEVEGVKESNGKLIEQVEQFSLNHHNDTETISSLQRQLSQKMDISENLEKSKIVLQKQLSTQLDDSEQKNVEIKNLRSDLEEQKVIIQKLQSENESLNSQNQEENERLVVLQKEIKGKTKEVTKLRNHCTSTMKVIQDMKFGESDFLEYTSKIENTICNQMNNLSAKLLKSEVSLTNLRTKLSSLIGFEVLKTEVEDFLDESQNDPHSLKMENLVEKFKEAKEYYRNCEEEKEKAKIELKRVLSENENMKGVMSLKGKDYASDEIMEFRPKLPFKDDHYEMSSVSNSLAEQESEIWTSRIEQGQQELLRNKQILGDIINLLVDYGEAEMLEKITGILSKSK